MEKFLVYENSTMILDQSGTQWLGFFISKCSVNVYKFMETKNITLSATSESAKELAHQVYNPNLFSGHYSGTHSDLNDKQNYVLSSTNCSLTLKKFDYNGYPAAVTSTIIDDFNENNKAVISDPKLWDSSNSFRRMKNNKRSNTDVSNIFLARILASNGMRFFGFLNDNDQINQFKIEGYRYLRPSIFLAWMVKDDYITKQKGVWCYEKAKKHDARWAEKNKSLANILERY